METIIKQSADEIILIGDNNFDINSGKVFINNHEITDIDTFFKVAEENTRLLEQNKKQKEIIDKAIELLKEKVKVIPFDENGEGGGLELTDYDIQDLLDILKESEDIYLLDYIKTLQQENKQLKEENKQFKKILNKIKSIDIFKEFSFPLMKRWEEQQVLSSIDYQFKSTFIKKIKELERGDNNDTIR